MRVADVGKECRLLRRDGQKKQLDVPVTVLPNIKHEQLLFVTMDFKQCKSYNDWKQI